jgi:hypothetical protein
MGRLVPTPRLRGSPACTASAKQSPRCSAYHVRHAGSVRSVPLEHWLRSAMSDRGRWLITIGAIGRQNIEETHELFNAFPGRPNA